MRAIVLSDTHVTRSMVDAGRSSLLPDPVYPYLERADVIFHAGDIAVNEVLSEMERFAPVQAVLGNNDHELVGRLPETLFTHVNGLNVAMIHDSGPTAGREARMRQRFPTAELVIFGHSHDPFDGDGLQGQRLFNPGSPTQRRRQPRHTIGELVIQDRSLVSHQIITLD